MNRNDDLSSRTNKVLFWAGRYYIVLVIALAQIVVTPLGILLAFLILSYNAGLTSPQLGSIAIFAAGIMLIRNALLLLGAHLFNKEATTRLGKWKIGEPLDSGTKEEKLAWRQITTLSWRYIAIAFASLLVLALLPTLIFMSNFLSANQDQLIYTLIAGIVAGLGLALMEVMLIERLLSQAREILVPLKFETQITGVPGFRLWGKFIIVFFALIIMSVLLVAPIGYHQTTRVLYEEIGSIKVLADLQVQSMVVAIFALLIGLSLSLILARAISWPIGQMISVFKKVEDGDLSQRVAITATDEVGELAIYFNRMADRLEQLQKHLEKRVSERTEQLKATIEVGQVATSILEPSELINKVVNLITERFGHYYAALFLIDPTGKWAELKEATGSAGQTLKSQGHQLEIGGKSMVSAAIVKHEPRVALDVGAESVRFDNPLLPQTRSEIALPLMIGNRVVGVLDVQSMLESAFDEENISTLQGMANQVAIALENARLFQEIQRSLTELRTTQQTYVTDAWADEARENLKFSYNAVSGSNLEDLADKSIDIPLKLREQSIGQIRMESGVEWSVEERNFIDAIAAQAALALENARLLQDAQHLASQEKQINDISGQIQKSTDLESILQNTVRELGRTLRAPKTFIQVGLVPLNKSDQE